jgi:sulfur carrier protein
LIAIEVNGEQSEIKPNSTIVDYLIENKVEGRFLVVINDEIIPRSAHESTLIQAHDRLDIMSPISGG